MKMFVLPAAVLMLLAGPAWSSNIVYDGSSNPDAVGWALYGGAVDQGFRMSVSGDNYAWFISDVVGAKTRYQWVQSPVNLVSTVGGTLEARVKSTWFALGNAGPDPFNMSIYDATGPIRYGNWLSVKPDQLRMKLQADGKASSAPETYAGDFSTDYRVIRLCYKLQDLRTRNQKLPTWAVYVDGGQTPVMHSWTTTQTETFSGPAWGAGSSGNEQDVYFDWISFTDTGAYPPRMNGAVQFVNGDPDGSAAPSGDSFTITWQTNVPTTGELHYSVSGSNTYATTSADPQNPTPATSHSVTVNGTVPGVTYDYYVVSTATGDQAISLPAEITTPNPFTIVSGPSVTVAPDGSSAVINWETSLPDSSSELHYGLDPTCPNVVVEDGNGGKTSHSITVTTQCGYYYYYYVRSTHAVYLPVRSSTSNFAVYCQGALNNPGFEDGLNYWTRLPALPFDGWYISGQWAIPAHGGAKYVGNVCQGQQKDMGGIYQTVTSTTPDRWREAKVWIWTRREGYPSWPFDNACRVGLDPNGGTDAGYFDGSTWVENPAVTWSGWAESDDSCTDGGVGVGGPWKQIWVLTKAAGPNTTVFLQVNQKWPLNWNMECFDDASFRPMTLPGELGKIREITPIGYPVEVTGKIVTEVYSVMSEAGIDTFCYIQEDDRSAGMKVKLSPTDPDTQAVMKGCRISVNGRFDVEGGEAEIVADDVSIDATDQPDPKPVALSNKQIGGGAFGPQLAVQDGSGLPTTGLLVRTCGKVVNVDYSMYLNFHSAFWIDDGSGVNGGVASGIKVYFAGLLQLTPNVDYVSCTGVAGMELFDPTPIDPVTLVDPIPGDEAYIRVLYLRDDVTDAQILPQ